MLNRSSQAWIFQGLLYQPLFWNLGHFWTSFQTSTSIVTFCPGKQFTNPIWSSLTLILHPPHSTSSSMWLGWFFIVIRLKETLKIRLCGGKNNSEGIGVDLNPPPPQKKTKKKNYKKIFANGNIFLFINYVELQERRMPTAESRK